MLVKRLSKLSWGLIVSAIIFVCTMPAMAGTLTIQTQSTVKVTGDTLNVTVTATNKGTSPVHNVQVHIFLQGERQKGPIKSRLDPGQSDEVLFERPLPAIQKGRYPLVVHVDFHDANQYPFSALSGMTFHYKEDVNANLISLGRDITIKKKGELRVDIRNLAFESRKVRATLFLPKEFSTPKPEIDFQIDARGEKTVSYEITNFSALSGANYPVFCSFEYEDKNTHYTAVARILVKVAKDENWFRRLRWIWIPLAGILIVILVIVLIKNRKMKTQVDP